MGCKLECRVAKERTDRGQPQVSTAYAQAAPGFQLIEKGCDDGRIDLFEVEIRRLPMEMPFSEPQELAERVPIRLDGMRARLALLYQPCGEELLEQRR